MEKTISKLFIKFYLFFLFYFIIFDYTYFNIFAFFIFALFYILKSTYEFTKIENNLLIVSPFLFYIKKLFFGLSNNLDLWNKTSNFFTHFTFADIKLTLEQLQCQSQQRTLLADSFQSMTENCYFESWRYGPLFHLIKLNINYSFIENILPIFLYVLFLLFLFTLYKKTNLTSLEFNIISLSSTVNLLFTQLNIDLIILLLVFYFVRYYKSYPNIYLTLLFFLALLKQHPIGIFFGLFFTANNFRKITKFSLFIISFFVINFYFYNLDVNYLNGQPRPTHAQLASGLLSISQYIWIEFFDRAIGFRLVIFILAIIILIIFTTLIFKKKTVKFNLNKNIYTDNQFEGGVLGWFLFISIYANWDYRNTILLLVFIYFNLNQNYKFPLIGLLLVTPFSPNLPLFLTYIMTAIKYFLYIVSVFVCLLMIIKLDRKYFKFLDVILRNRE